MKARFIAMYLPQFHPIPDNDQFWGKGFTEWTNVAKAKPVFRGHYQPHIPADLGFYDLRLEESRIAQAELAQKYGVEGFCYWYYWFGNGEKILERPFTEVLKSGKPDFPFCLAWANHTWATTTWSNDKKKSDVIIKEQKYLGEKDYIAFFYDVLPALKDKRYIQVDGKPLFLIFNPNVIPDVDVFIKTWKRLAVENGLKGIYIVGSSSGVSYSNKSVGGNTHHLPSLKQMPEIYKNMLEKGFDGINSQNMDRAMVEIEGPVMNFIKKAIFLHSPIHTLDKCDQHKFNEHLLTEYDSQENVFPSLYCNWDRTPRAGRSAKVLTNSTPDVFKKLLRKALKIVENKSDDHKIIFIRSWNEWGEGNHLEPDLKYGCGYLEAIKDILSEDDDNN